MLPETFLPGERGRSPAQQIEVNEKSLFDKQFQDRIGAAKNGRTYGRGKALPVSSCTQAAPLRKALHCPRLRNGGGKVEDGGQRREVC